MNMDVTLSLLILCVINCIVPSSSGEAIESSNKIYFDVIFQGIGELNAPQQRVDIPVVLRQTLVYQTRNLSQTGCTPSDVPIVDLYTIELPVKRWVTRFGPTTENSRRNVELNQCDLEKNTITSIKDVPLRVNCAMNFRYYPFDEHHCAVGFSVQSSDPSFNIQWNPTGLDDLKFHISHYVTSRLSLESDGTGTLVLNFRARRPLNHVSLLMFALSIAYVSLSWGGFYLDVSSAPARVAIGIMPMIVLVICTASVRDQMPSASPGTAADFWVLGCAAFIIAAFFEFILVSHLKNLSKIKSERAANGQGSQPLPEVLVNSHRHKEYHQEATGPRPPPSPCSLRTIYNPSDDHRLIGDMNFHLMPMGGNNSDQIQSRWSSGRLSDMDSGHESELGSDSSSGSKEMHQKSQFERDLGRLAELIDQKCRFIFPILFLVFLIVYFSIVVVIRF